MHGVSPVDPVARPEQSAPPKRRSAGRIAAVVLLGVVVLGGGGFAAWRMLGSNSSGSGVVAGPGGAASPDGAGGSNAPAGSADPSGALQACSLVADADLAAVLGDENWLVRDIGAVVTRAYDSRVLAGVPASCAGTTPDHGKLVRIARYQVGDAAARFAEEKQKAVRGAANGPYLGTVVQSGDEAFCTTGSKTAAGSSAGVLVRRGDELVYVSTTAAGDDDGANCDLSLKLVAKVHAP
jgi:hypothetical protein